MDDADRMEQMLLKAEAENTQLRAEIERLQDGSGQASWNEWYGNQSMVNYEPTVRQQQAEIERLQGEHETLRQALFNCRDLRERDVAEIERLTAALREVAKGTEHPCAYCFDMANLARRALEEK